MRRWDMKMRMTQARPQLCVVLCVLILAISIAPAGTIWDGGGADANINTAANWDSNTLPTNLTTVTGTSTPITFGTGFASGNPLVNVPIFVKGFIFNASSAVTIANPSNNLITLNPNSNLELQV